MTEAVIQTSNLGKSYNNRPALQQINLRIERGVTTGLVGPNGAGKTTLFSLLCGFLKPTTGEVSVLGRPPGHVDLCGRVSILPQDAQLLKTIAIRKQLAMFAELQGFSGAAADQEALRVLDAVNLKSSAEQTIERLSHGMLKRVSIAQAFIGQPEVILLDEPTAGLDPGTADGIKRLIRRLSGQATVVITSHNLEVIEDLCQQIIILNKGRLHSHGAVSDLVDRTARVTLRLESDASEILCDRIRALPQVTEVTPGPAGSHRLLVCFAQQNSQHLEIELLKCLADNNTPYREIIRGELLQDSVSKQLD